MATFVCVHGAFHTAWAWNGVQHILEAKGHRVVAGDLPGHGASDCPNPEVTMARYVDEVCSWVDAAPQPVVLVGNSMGGAIISLVAEALPGQVGKLVYVAGFMAPSGKSIMDVVSSDESSEFLPNFEMAPDGSYGRFRDEPGLRERLMYADMDPEAAGVAISHLMTRQATQPFMVPMRLTDDRFGTVPRYFIECTADRVLSHGKQVELREALPCERVVTLDLPHIPHVSDAKQTAAALLSFLGAP